MAGKAFTLTWNVTSVSGTKTESKSTWTQIINSSCMLNHVFIKSSRGDTQFDFAITSPSGNEVYHRENIVSELSESPNIILRGLYSLTLRNITNGQATLVDDTFASEFMFENKKDK